MSNEQESGQPVSTGQNGQPAPQEQSGDKQTSTQAPVFSAEQQAWIEDLVKRTDQSAKDKAYRQIERKVTSNQDQLDKFAELLKQPGMTVDKAKREMQIDQLLTEAYAQPASAPPASSNAGQQKAPDTVDFTAIYQAVGVDPNNNDVVRLTMQHGGNEAGLKAALVDYKMRQNSQPAANPATAAAPSGGGSPSAQTQLDNLNSEMAGLMKNPRANYNRIQEIQKEIAGLSK